MLYGKKKLSKNEHGRNICWGNLRQCPVIARLRTKSTLDETKLFDGVWGEKGTSARIGRSGKIVSEGNFRPGSREKKKGGKEKHYRSIRKTKTGSHFLKKRLTEGKSNFSGIEEGEGKSSGKGEGKEPKGRRNTKKRKFVSQGARPFRQVKAVDEVKEGPEPRWGTGIFQKTKTKAECSDGEGKWGQWPGNQGGPLLGKD